MLSITVQDAALRQYLGKLQTRLTDMQPVLSDIGYTLETRTRERFETRQGPNGQAWAPWAELTREARAKKGSTGPLLQEYGTMLDSLGYQVQEGGGSVRIGFAQPYAAYHEWGTKRMPRRGLLAADPDAGTLGHDDLQAVLAIVNDWLSGAAA